jgi:hypothetical protein
MELNIAEKYLLIILHLEKSRYLVSDHMINPGLFGSMLADLAMEGKIEIRDKRIISKSDYTKISEAHNQILGKISKSKKAKRIKTWISNFTWNARKYRYMILHELAMKSMIKLENKRFIIFNYKNARIINQSVRQSILDDIKDTIQKKKTLNDEVASLMGIINACKLYKVITKDKSELKLIKPVIKEMVNQDSISREVQLVINEIQAASVTTTVAVTSG